MALKIRVESPAPRVGQQHCAVLLGIHENAGLEIVPVVLPVVVVPVLYRVNVAAHFLGRVGDRFQDGEGARHSTPPPEEEPSRRAREGEGHQSAAADGSQEPRAPAFDTRRQFDGLGRGYRSPF